MLNERLNRLAHRLRSLPPWWIGFLLAVSFLCVTIGFAERSANLDARIATWEYATPDAERIALCGLRKSDDQPKPVDRRAFDGRFPRGYGIGAAECWLTAVGPEGRSLYAKTQASLDVVFPFAYGFLFAIFVARGLPRRKNGDGDEDGRGFCCHWLLLVPIGTVFFDLLEGLLTIWMATTGPDGLGRLVYVAAGATIAKTGLFLVSLAVIAFLGRRFLGHLAAHLVLARVPALGLAIICLLPMQAIARQATVLNVFNLETGLQLGLTTLMAVLAIVLLGHAFVIAWRLGSKRTDMASLDLPLFEGEMTMRPLAMSSALATVLLLPFLWVLGTRAEPDVPRFALVLGALTAVAALAACLWLVQRVSDRWKGQLLDRIFCRLGDGYWEDGRTLPGHKLAAGFAVLLAVVYLVFYLPYSPDKTALPPAALPFVLLFVTLVCQLLSGLAFFFDRWRVPVLLVVLVAALGVNALMPKTHEFETTYDKHFETTFEEHTPATPNLGSGTTLTVIAADGGGIQAAAWSTQVLTSLQTELGDEFTDSVRLISSVSGGSVGAYFYLAGAVHDEENGPKPASRDCVRRAAAASSLSATAWGLVGPDFQRLLLPFAVPPSSDRGWAVEQAWMNSAERMRQAIGPNSGAVEDDCEPRFETYREALGSSDDALRLTDLRRMADDGRLPYVVFNSTFVETGGQAFFTSADPSLLGCTGDDACWDFRNLDLRAATAARMSATFPYVTPIARPSLEEFDDPDPKIPQWSVADGGYFDNFGSFAAIRWLRSVQSKLAKNGIQRVVLVQILTFPETQTAPPDGSEGLLYATAGPLQTILAVRTSSQLDRAREELNFLGESFRWGDAKTKAPEFEFVELRPPYRPNQSAPLSWHLSRQNIEMIRAQWREMCANNSGLDRLREIFGATRSCAEPD